MRDKVEKALEEAYLECVKELFKLALHGCAVDSKIAMERFRHGFLLARDVLRACEEIIDDATEPVR